MHRLMAFLGTLALVLLTVGCDTGSAGEGEGASLSAALNAAHKVLVCHPAAPGDKLPLVLLVDEHAIAAHLGHGDWLVVEEEVCGDGLDNDCDGPADEDCDPCAGGKCCPEGENCMGQQ